VYHMPDMHVNIAGTHLRPAGFVGDSRVCVSGFPLVFWIFQIWVSAGDAIYPCSTLQIAFVVPSELMHSSLSRRLLSSRRAAPDVSVAPERMEKGRYQQT
jgi:hypothetical protein